MARAKRRITNDESQRRLEGSNDACAPNCFLLAMQFSSFVISSRFDIRASSLYRIGYLRVAIKA